MKEVLPFHPLPPVKMVEELITTPPPTRILFETITSVNTKPLASADIDADSTPELLMNSKSVI